MRGRRAAMAAGAGALVVLAGAFVAREDIAAWYVGYRFVWAPEGYDVCWVRSAYAGKELLVSERRGAERPRAGLWSVGSGELALIDPPPGTEAVVRPYAMNNRGQVVGALESLDGSRSRRPFLWRRESGMELLAAPGGRDGWLEDINDDSQAVGELAVGRPGDTPETTRAVRWTGRDGFSPLESLTPSSPCRPSSISAAGWILGASTAPDGKEHPVLWQPPHYRPRDLGLSPDFDGGLAIVVGDQSSVLVNLWAGTTWLWATRSCLWTEERGLTELPLPLGWSSSRGSALGRHGSVLFQAVGGVGSEGRTKSFFLRDGTFLEIPGPRGVLDVEYDSLSDRGWLIGTARRGNGPDSRRGFVAIPVR